MATLVSISDTPSECIFFDLDDTLLNVEAANEAGLAGVLVDREGRYVEYGDGYSGTW